MSTFRNPVGPQSSKVYWRRRLVVALGAIAVIIVIVLIVVQPRGGDQPAPASSASEQPEADAPADEPAAEEPEPTATSSSGAALCNPASVALAAVTDMEAYGPESFPQLSFSLTNETTVECAVSAGSDVLEYRITSGDDLIWSSTDCQTDPQAAEAVLEPGVPLTSAPLGWDRTRSTPDTCDAERPAAIADGASYDLTVVLGELQSEPTRFLLN